MIHEILLTYCRGFLLIHLNFFIFVFDSSFSSCGNESPNVPPDVDFSNILLDEASSLFPSDDDSSDDHYSIEIVRSKYFKYVDLSLSSLSVPLDQDDNDEEDKDLSRMFDLSFSSR